MARDFKPVNDRTINDVNAMNRDAWDSGEFRHGDADDPRFSLEGSATAYENTQKANAARNTAVKKLMPARTGGMHVKQEGVVATKRRAYGEDVRHTPEGGQQLVRGGQVVSHHDEEKSNAYLDPQEKSQAAQRAKNFKVGMEMTEAVKKDKEGREALGGEAKDDAPKKAVHLPRRAGRQWRKGEWS